MFDMILNMSLALKPTSSVNMSFLFNEPFYQLADFFIFGKKT